MFETGFLQLGRIRGAPVRIHWSVALGALFFTGLRFEPAAWLGFLLVILVHELGHAAVVLASGMRVEGVEILAFGGVCRWSGDATAMQRAIIAWGGVLAQLVLYGATWAVVLLTGGPRSLFGLELVSVFTQTNLWIAVINLLPIPPLDGAAAWSLIPAWRARRAARRPRAVGIARARREVREIEVAERRTGGLSEVDEARLKKLFDDAGRARR